MVRWTHLIILSFLCTAAACPPELQQIEICRIKLAETLAESKCHCAILDEQRIEPLEYCDEFLAMDEPDVRRIGARLAECKRLEETCAEHKAK